MLVDFLLFGLVALLMVPLICAYYAHSRGRSFWLWFLIGSLLPIISYFILLLLPDKSNPIEEDLKELRLQNKMLGTVSDIPIDDPIRKLINREKTREIQFKVREEKKPESQKQLEILIDREPLINIIRRAELPYAQSESKAELAGAYQAVPLTLALSPYRHFLGEPSRRFSHEGKAVIFTANSDVPPSERHEWRLSAKISLYRRYVIWHDFTQEARIGKWGYFQPEILVFNRYQYEDALEQLEHYVS